jgi:KUP system potassium uptake protein
VNAFPTEHRHAPIGRGAFGASLALAALGVVFGDIATSPLYALQAAFGQGGVDATHDNVIGLLSLVTWSLILLVSIKYLVFVLRADNEGEGGSMALLTMARRALGTRSRWRGAVLVLGLVGVSLFFGDSVITPAISVLSAAEGLKAATPSLKPFVVPLAVAILIVLFAIQRFGSRGVAILFSPVMGLWLITIAALGVYGIAHAPQILSAISPLPALAYLGRNGFAGFSSLGAVILVLTGAEALYADLGHFGARAIRTAWIGLVFPSLILSYFGQGAWLLVNPAHQTSPFFAAVPPSLTYAVVVLACAATVVASQAVISGTYSMAREAAQLGYLPRFGVLHTSRQIEGQIYSPVINGLLLTLVVAVTLGFRSSEKLASAFGFAVSGTMLITTVLLSVVARKAWGWGTAKLLGFALLFISIDALFLGASATKLEHGAWFPIALSVVALTVIGAWRRGRRRMADKIRKQGLTLESFIHSIETSPPPRVPGVAIFLTADPDRVPRALLHNLKHNKILHETNVILTTETLDTPYAASEQRSRTERIGATFWRVSLAFGFAESPDVPRRMAERETMALRFDPMQTTYFASRETAVVGDRKSRTRWYDELFAFLARNSQRATAYFCIPQRQLVEIGSIVEL